MMVVKHRVCKVASPMLFIGLLRYVIKTSPLIHYTYASWCHSGGFRARVSLPWPFIPLGADVEPSVWGAGEG